MPTLIQDDTVSVTVNQSSNQISVNAVGVQGPVGANNSGIIFTLSGYVESNFAKMAGIPATSTSNGISGQIALDTGYLYVCVTDNVWKRANLNSW